MNTTLFALIALTLVPCSAPDKVCAETKILHTYSSPAACLNNLPEETDNVKYQCQAIPVKNIKAEKQNKEMQDLFFGMTEKFLDIAKENQ